VHELTIDIKQRRTVVIVTDNMVIPELVVERSRLHPELLKSVFYGKKGNPAFCITQIHIFHEVHSILE
jgi:hypothetical protein